MSDQEEVMLRLRHELFHGGSRVMEYLSVSPAKASEFSISAARSDGSLEGTQTVTKPKNSSWNFFLESNLDKNQKVNQL